MPNIMRLLGRMIAGIGGSSLSVGMSFAKYPFTFPEKALTSDWMIMGEDINKTMSRLKDDGTEKRA
ncbi:MAG: hypothetical protein K0R63_960 [Rickettsiales bacterium]|jgi:hypothetical protein|nr:hypothetical protein [Rickettsiales bacterium]